jgi:hypothetical protein
MTGVHGFKFAIHEVETQIIAGGEFEFQRDAPILKRDIVEDGDAVIGFSVFGDLHHAVLQIDLLVAFGAPGTVAGPSVADVFLACGGFITGEVVGKKKHRFSGAKMGAKGQKEGGVEKA